VFETGTEPGLDRLILATDLADVILALRAMPIPAQALADGSSASYRGRPLRRLDETFRRAVKACRSLEGCDLDLDDALEVWASALELPDPDGADRPYWFHGDLVAENLLLNQGRLTAVLDFGGLSIGNPTVDLHGAWELFDPPARALFRDRLNADDAEWLCGRAWALAIALIALSYYWETLPGRRRDRLAMARAVLADAE
jgi:aminoglycoside phosphotransferase (APT) family kinase protein